MKIYLASDHAGFEHKEALKKHLMDQGFEVQDFGAEAFVSDDDYVPYMMMSAQAISANPADKAVIFGGSGQGEAITANKFPSVRAAVYYGGPLDIIKLSREHNDANILSIGARFLSVQEMITAVDLWLNTPFSNEERHVRRINELNKISFES